WWSGHQGSGQLDDLGSGVGAGARERERDSAEPRSDGGHEPGERGGGHDSQGPRHVDRGERRARLGRAGHGRGGDPLLLRRGRHLPANALTIEAVDGTRTNLLGLPPDRLAEFFVSLGEKPYRARQIMRWVYQRGVGDFAAMTDLSVKLRERLAEIAEIAAPNVLRPRPS